MGLDVGTTTISLVIIDLETHKVVDSRNEPHNADISPDGPGAHLQDAERILALCEQMIKEMSAATGNPRAIGITGQMHGLLYLDREKRPVSPVYSWLDNRLHWKSSDGTSYEELMRERLAGTMVPAGYGAATHFVHRLRGSVPSEARYAVTLLDYISMKIGGAAKPVTDPTMAHSFGGYLTREGRVDEEFWHTLDGNEIALPELSRHPCFLGENTLGAAVTTPIGDNQASYLGSVAQPQNSLLVNVGTSGQVSVYLEDVPLFPLPTGIEERPFPGRGLLWVGATLTGGKSLDILASLVSETDQLINGKITRDPYHTLSNSLVGLQQTAPPTVVTKFSGSRENGAERGSISGINTENFTLGHLYSGFLAGIADELATLWERMNSVDPEHSTKFNSLVAGGNALRLSEPLRSAVSRRFGMELYLTPYDEPAAYGAAVLAYSVLENIPVTEASQDMVQYL